MVRSHGESRPPKRDRKGSISVARLGASGGARNGDFDPTIPCVDKRPRLSQGYASGVIGMMRYPKSGPQRDAPEAVLVSCD
jgi:hypothetical protein